MRWTLSEDGRMLALAEASGPELDHLNVFFTRQIPNARHDPRVKRGVWDGMISMFKRNRYLPAGLWGELVATCEKMDFQLSIDGVERLFDTTVVREHFDEWVERGWRESPIKARDYQVDAAFRMVKNMSCLAELATSAGKSLIAFMVVSYLFSTGRAKRTLIIVPTVDLVTQVVSDFETYNRSSVRVPLVAQRVYSGAEQVDDANLVVGTFQSLVKRPPDWLSSFDLVLVDEVHKAKSHSIKAILEKCTGSRRRLGLSGTVPKDDSLDRLTIMSNTGPVVTQVKADRLIKEGHISNLIVYVLEMRYAPEDVKDAFRQVYNAGPDRRKDLLVLEKNYAIESATRLRFVTNFILRNEKNSLVLFHRIDYGKALFDALRQKSDRPVYYIDGETSAGFREAYKDKMEDGRGKILVASFGTFSTGINVTNLHAVYLTESFKSDVVIKQSIGRGLRKHATKDRLVVVDFVDDFRSGKFINYLYRHSVERRRIYQEERFPFTVRQVDPPPAGGLFG